VSTIPGKSTTQESTDYCGRFAGATPAGVADNVIPPGLNGNEDVWAQDEFQIGIQEAPYHSMEVVLDSKRDGMGSPSGGLTPFPPGLLGVDFGHIQISDGSAVDSLDSFGNLEVSPPCTVGGIHYPFGRIYYGDGGATGRRMDADVRDFLDRQRVQSPVTLDSDWLHVGHVDEFMSILPDPTGTHGWKVVLADPHLAVDLLAPGGAHPGVDPDLYIPRYAPLPPTGFGVGTIGQLLAKPLVNPIPNGSATIEEYNQNEVEAILYGPPSAGHTGGLKAAIRSAFGLTNADFIEVPVLFDRGSVWDAMSTRSVAITPDLANGAVYPGTYIAPDNFLSSQANPEEDIDADFILDAGEDSNGNGLLDTGRDRFHLYLDTILPGGMAGVYIDDWAIYHIGEGEVHCSSNEKRTIPGAVHWWE